MNDPQKQSKRDAPDAGPQRDAAELRRFALSKELRDRYYELGFWRTESLWASFVRIADGQPDSIAFVDGERTFTFCELKEQAIRFGRALSATGLAAGDAVALHGRHSLESTIAVIGCAYAGVVTALLPHMFSTEQIRAILENSRARVLISLGEASDIERASAGWTGADLDAFVVPDTFQGSADDKAGSLTWTNFLGRGAQDAPDPGPRAADDLALLIFSSGTTGEPKGVMHSANTVRFAVETYSRYQSITPSDTNLVVTAFGFIGSSVLGTFLSYFTGCRTVLQRGWSAPEALSLIETRRVTHLLLMPTHAIDILESPDLDKTNCSSLVRGVVAGIGEKHRLDARKRFCGRPYPMYGMSESPAHVTGSTDDDIDHLRTAEGKPLPGTDLLICDDDDRPMAAGTQGNILVRGPNRFLGYYRNTSLNLASLTPDGYFRTGDVGFVDERGMLTFVTRSKDIIRRGGVTITPADIEAALRPHPNVADVAVIALPDPRLGERACACVILRTGCALTLGDLTSFLEARSFPRYQWPESVVICEEFPRTPSLKVQKPELRRQVLARLATGPGL